MAKNIIEKIWDEHVVHQEPEHPAIFAIDFTLLHEVTSAQAFDVLREKNLPVYDKAFSLATIDHSVPTSKDRYTIKDLAAKHQVESLRKNTRDFQLKFFDFDSQHQGIVHVIGPELGITQPGMTLVCGDSHTSTHGAFGAFACGIGTSVLSHVLATGCMLLNKPKVMQVDFRGKPGKGIFAKDMILKLISEIGIGGGTGYVIEYTGDAIRAMTMEERMTLCNMSIECGAVAGLISPDETTYEYIKGKRYAPDDAQWENAVNYWKTFASDINCSYDKVISVDIENLKPMVTWGTNPAQGIQLNQHIPVLQSLEENERMSAQRALDYVGLKENTPMAGVPIDWAFIGSCTNGRIEDLRIVAKILKGRKIHKNVTMYVVPGSEGVLAQAEKEGLAQIFREAGADFRMPGCSMCLGMNDDKIPEGERCISSTNRNFVGRQGPGSRTHLASPATVAASAIEGKITSPEQYL